MSTKCFYYDVNKLICISLMLAVIAKCFIEQSKIKQNFRINDSDLSK